MIRLYDHLDFLLEQKKQAESDLLREAKKHPIARILETAPGFGPIRAARVGKGPCPANAVLQGLESCVRTSKTSLTWSG